MARLEIIERLRELPDLLWHRSRMDEAQAARAELHPTKLRLEGRAAGKQETAEDIRDLLTDLPAILAAERERAEKAEKSRQHTQQWYAVRWERLHDLIRDRSKAAEPGSEMAQVWPDIASILANGTLGPPDHPYEPPTYAQQLNIAKHRVEKAEAALARRDAEWREGLLSGKAKEAAFRAAGTEVPWERIPSPAALGEAVDRALESAIDHGAPDRGDQ